MNETIETLRTNFYNRHSNPSKGDIKFEIKNELDIMSQIKQKAIHLKDESKIQDTQNRLKVHTKWINELLKMDAKTPLDDEYYDGDDYIEKDEVTA